MAMVEIRKDYFTNKLSVVLPDRGLKPGQVIPQRNEKCSYCPGNEDMTLPADLVLVKRGDTLLKQTDSEGDTIKNWSVRIFPSKNPVVTPNASPLYGESPHYSEPAVGYHYVLVATPRHDQPIWKIDKEQWTNILASLQDKVRWLYAQKSVSYVLFYVNGVKNGSSTNSHPNIQIVTTPRVPPNVELEAETVHIAQRAWRLSDVSGGRTETGGPRRFLPRVFHLFHAVEFNLPIDSGSILSTTRPVSSSSPRGRCWIWP